MAYLHHIDNLYKDQTIMLFKEVYCLEKVHGTNAKIEFKDDSLRFFPGGEKQDRFESLFNKENILEKIKSEFPITVYGEAYGGKCQGMSDIYAKELRFIGFDVLVGERYLSVPQAEEFILNLGIEFVPYTKVVTNIDELNRERDAESKVAIRRGCGPGKNMEGIVIRPLIELTKNNGSRVIVKHKRDDFRETKAPRQFVDGAKLIILENAQAIADEWVTPKRLNHVLQNFPAEIGMEKVKEIMDAMSNDIQREGARELVWSKEAEKAINKNTALLFKKFLKEKLVNT